MEDSNDPITVKALPHPRKGRSSVIQSPVIVGIGTSAGGLEALEGFFTHVPASSGMAFVVVQHIDPTKKGMLPELLQRVTPMKVMQASHRLKVQANCVYVIPPNKDLSVVHGTLLLQTPIAPRGLRLPIDMFFSALAQDRQECAIGVVLSGMGSDGTVGLKAIKQHGGLALVQSPESAQFDSMPRSAINAGLADIVASVQELPSKIIECLKHMPLKSSEDAEPLLELKSHGALEQIVSLLRERNGNDFSLYKKNTLYRRIERRMLLHKINGIANYAQFLRSNPQELTLLFKELLIGVTNFFRDAAIWEIFKTQALPALLARYPHGKALRAWVPACSTGEEVYSLAIMFKEALAELNPTWRFSLQIFATDLNGDAITFARWGLYSERIEADVPPALLERYFVKEKHSYRVHKDIREMVVFAPQNIIMDPPFTKLDILTCRNLLIYLGPELQKKLIPLFHYALVRNGILLLGIAETIGSFTHLFTPIDSKSRLYTRNDNTAPLGEVDFPTRVFPVASQIQDRASEDSLTQNNAGKMAMMSTPTTNVIPNLQTLADQLLLQSFAPAAVLVNAEGDIIYINGRTGKYLEPAAGKANWNIYAMAREGLRQELSAALKKAQAQTEPVHTTGLTIGTNGGRQSINLTVQAIATPEALRGALMVVFSDVGKPIKLSRKTLAAPQKQLLDELRDTQEEMSAMRDEMQTSQEELKSTNEELQSTNEELQSTNEELTTSKEEMQSLNEELQTVNAELQSKVDDLSWVNNDMKNLLNSTEIATIFLDDALNVRRFTTHATHLYKLIATDIGRPLSDIVTNLDYPQLQQDTNEVLRTLVFVENQVRTLDGRWFKVRIMPYRTHDNVINGAVITFAEISDLKKLEDQLKKVKVKTGSSLK